MPAERIRIDRISCPRSWAALQRRLVPSGKIYLKSSSWSFRNFSIPSMVVISMNIDFRSSGVGRANSVICMSSPLTRTSGGLPADRCRSDSFFALAVASTSNISIRCLLCCVKPFSKIVCNISVIFFHRLHMDWETGHVSGLIAQVIPPTVTPGGMVMLHIVVSANTPPGSYHFTLRGETQGTFKTSEDTVTVVVQPSPKSHGNNNNQPKNETSQTSSAPLPVTKAQATVSSQASKKARQNKHGVVRGLVAAIVVLAVVGTVLYISRNIFHNDINSLTPSGSPTTTTYAGTQTFTIYSALGGAPETSTGAASVQVD